jgi:broad-specificity NMP kinase
VAAVLVTGMSGTGKSSALAELARRGYRVVDTDYDGWTHDVPSPSGDGSERLWREDLIDALLTEHEDGVLFVSGCVPNQGRFYPRFDAVVLLSAPADVILARVAGRDTNDYGKSDAERALILRDLATVEPLLRTGATAEIDTRVPLDVVADELERIASRSHPERKLAGRIGRDYVAPVEFGCARQFVRAVAAHDFEAAMELVDPDVETVTPRGTVRGVAACRQVLQKAGGDEQFAMEQAEPQFEEIEGDVLARTREIARWRETGEVAYERTFALRLTLDDDRIVRIVVLPGAALPSQVDTASTAD